MNLPRDYDAWRLEGLPESDALGEHEGETCNRVPEPDEDAPRGYRPRPCNGTMVERHEGAEYHETSWVECDTCGELA